MRIYLPSYLSARTIYSVIGQALSEANALRADRFSFDFSPLIAVEPAGVAALSALIDWLCRRGAPCILSPGSSSPHEPVAFTLRRMGFFPRVLHYPVSSSPPPDARWMPLTRILVRTWSRTLGEEVLPWVVSQAGVSRFAAEWNLAALGSLFSSSPDDSPPVTWAAGRIDMDRARLELAFATVLANDDVPDPALTDGETTFDRLVVGLPEHVAGWFTLHEGWRIVSAVPDGRRRARSLYPAPVAYPGRLFDLVIDLTSFFQQSMLNEPIEEAEAPWANSTSP